MSGADAGSARGGGDGPEQDAARSPRTARHVPAALALVGLTLALYAGTLTTGWFEIDDALYVPENSMLQELTAASFARMLGEPYFGNYSPVHLLSYALDRALFGLRPFAFHLSSVLWGGACAVGVYALAWRLTRSARAAWIAGVLFALHPAHVEAIAWVSSRKDLVAAAFAIPATIAYLDYRERGGSKARYALSLVLFALATAGKLSVVVLPGVFFLFDVLLERRRLLGAVLDKLPYALVVVYVGLRASEAQPETNVDVSAGAVLQIGGWFVWLLTGLGDYVIFRPVPDADASGLVVGAWAALFAAGLLLPWAWAGRALRDGSRQAGLALCLVGWVLLGLLPSQVLGFLYPVSDRYLFFPSVPFAVLVALGADALLRSPRAPGALRVATQVGLVALAGVWSWKSWSGARSWADPRSVFHVQARTVPDLNAHEYLALHHLRALDVLLEPGRTELPEDLAALAEAVGLDADVLRRESASASPRRPATELFASRLMDVAWRELEAAAAIPTARSLPSVYYRRGRLLDLRGEPAAALAEFERAEREARIHPIEDVARAYVVQSLYSQALMSERLGDVASALRRMRKAASEDATFADVGAQVRRLEEELPR